MLAVTTMHLPAATSPAQPKPAPSAPAVGCATCWAAKYCAAFSLESPQPPPTCPLLPKPAPQPRPHRLRLVHG